jgi:large subunit ribosomal protein L10
MDADTKRQKSQELRRHIEGTSALVLVGFSGLTVADADALRGKLREAGCSYHVYKNSTVRFAVEGTPHAAIIPLLAGATGLAYNADDPGAPARVLRDFAKSNDAVKIKGGVIDGTLLDEAGVERLASMPGPRELKAQFLALLMTPATQMVRVLNAVPQSILNVINAKKDKEAA